MFPILSFILNVVARLKKMCLNSDISAGIYTLVVVIKEKVLSGIKEKVDSY